MKFQRYMTGRGNRGYGFKASTALHPQTSYMAAVRESDTGATDIPVLEILTTKYGELGAVASFHAQEGRASGYMDILFPVPQQEHEPEWNQIMENPGCLLYLPHVDQKEFLRTSDLGNNVRINDDSKLAQDIPIPEIPHEYTFNLDDDTMADLAADIWYASSIRLNNPANPESWPVVHLQLTEEMDQKRLMNMGCEFYCNKLIPALPLTIRRIVSVSIGAKYQDAISAKNGGSASLVIPQYDAEQKQMIPGRYIITETTHQHQSLNPLGDEQLWRNFGKAVLQYTQTGKSMNNDSTDSWLNDFFSISELTKEQAISANWIYAFMLFNGHAQAQAISNNSGAFESEEPEKITEIFKSDVWMAADTELLTALGLDQNTARSCLLWIERDMIRALNANSKVLIDSETYKELFKRAFSLPEKNEHIVLINEIKELYGTVLTRDRNCNEGEMVGWLIGLLPHDGAEQQFPAKEDERLSLIVKQALTSLAFRPTEDQLRTLNTYAATGKQQSKTITEYAIRLLSEGYDPQRLSNLRTTQYEGGLDESFKNMIDQRVDEIFDVEKAFEFRNSIKLYIQNQPTEGAKSADELTGYLLQRMSVFISDHADELRNRIGDVRQAFAVFGAEQSEECMRALTVCIETPNIPFTTEDQSIIQTVLYQNGEIGSDMAKALDVRFDEALDEMFSRAVKNNENNDLERTVIGKQWTDCLKQTGPQEFEAQKELQTLMAESLNKYISYNNRELRHYLPIVQQAFRDIGMQDSSCEMEAICECMQEPGVTFTENDAAIAKRVLVNKNSPATAERMCEILTHLFEDSLDEIIEADSTRETAFIACFNDKLLKEPQVRLKKNLLDTLKRYLDKNATEMTTNVSRIMSLYEAFEHNNAGTADRVESFCKILETRAREQDEGEMLTQQDLDVLQGKLLRDISDDSKLKLIETLQILFKKDLPRMVEDSDARILWQVCLKDKNVGQPLRQKAVNSVQDYIQANADEMYNTPVQVMDVCEAFGADSREKLEVWILLLKARIENEKGQLILTKEYNDTLENDIQRARPETQFVLDVVEAFKEDLPLIAEGQSKEQWVRFRTKNILPSRLWNDFDETAQREYITFVNEQTILGEKGDSPDYLSSLLELARDLNWTKNDEVRDTTIRYLQSLKRDNISLEEMQIILSFRHSSGSQMNNVLNEVFGRNLPDMARRVNETELATWHLAAEKGIDLKRTFSDIAGQITREPDQISVTAEQIIQPLLITGRALNQGGTSASFVIDMISKRKNDHIDRLMTTDERDALQETVLGAQDNATWKKYLDLLNWEPRDSENEERDAQLKIDAAALRHSAFAKVTREQAMEMRGYSEWKKQLLGVVHQRMSHLSEECKDYEALCRIPEEWGINNDELPFLQFPDLLSFDESDSLESTCMNKAECIVQTAKLSSLKKKDLYDKNTWFGKMLDRIVAQRVSNDCRTLVTECNTPAAVQDLLNLIDDTGNKSSTTEMVDALDFILDGRKGKLITDIAQQLKSMNNRTKDVAANLLQIAIYGEQSHSWKEKWTAIGEPAQIGMAGLVYLACTDPQWEPYLDILFQGIQDKEEGMENGNHPVQRLLYATDMLKRCGMVECTERLPEELKRHKPAIYNQLRGIGLKGKIFEPLKDQSNRTGEAIYQLLFTK